MTAGSVIRATYRVQGDTVAAREVARAIAYEQTVELPATQVDGTSAAVNVGRIEAVESDARYPDAQCVRIAYPAILASAQLGQLFNLLYGNISMYRGVRLVDIDLPGGLLGNSPVRVSGPTVCAA